MCCKKGKWNVGTKALSMRNQSQRVFCVIFVGIPQNQKGCLIYIPSTQKTVSSHDVVFDKTFSSALAYTSRPYSEALTVQPEVSYIPYAASSHEKLAAL